ncbi:MAG: hypothetical protein CMO74_08510 [Verrucomicrobiales bacterium]|nr:hypothetical protein [Verrucomicrobiales bacterium]
MPTPPTPVPAAQVPGLRVIQFRVFNNATTGIKYVVGDLGNEATQPHSRIKVEFRLFDANDQLLGTASDTRVTELAPGTVWPFQALIQDAAATRAELAGVTLLP